MARREKNLFLVNSTSLHLPVYAKKLYMFIIFVCVLNIQRTPPTNVKGIYFIPRQFLKLQWCSQRRRVPTYVVATRNSLHAPDSGWLPHLHAEILSISLPEVSCLLSSLIGTAMWRHDRLRIYFGFVSYIRYVT